MGLSDSLIEGLALYSGDLYLQRRWLTRPISAGKGPRSPRASTMDLTEVSKLACVQSVIIPLAYVGCTI